MSDKHSVQSLAIFGGSPLFDRTLHVNQPWMADRAVFDSYLDQIWSNSTVTNDGPLVRQLEQSLSEKLDVEQCVAMVNGTVAMSVLISVLGITGEVILPSFTFISTAHSLRANNIKPVFCDVGKNSWNLDPKSCEDSINSQTTAIIPTHLWGRSCDVKGFEELAEKRGLHLIFDAAHAFGCSKGQSLLGGFGDAEVFSLHATKSFHSGEGGIITCKDEALAKELRRARNFGFVNFDEVARVGTNAKMNELAAALGLANLQQFSDKVELNRAVFQAYRDGLSHIEMLGLVGFDEAESNNYWYISTTVSEDFGLSRNQLVDILRAENILARKYFSPGCHKMMPYAVEQISALPNTEWISDRVMMLPGGASLETESVYKICNLLKFVSDNSAEIGKKAKF